MFSHVTLTLLINFPSQIIHEEKLKKKISATGKICECMKTESNFVMDFEKVNGTK